MFYFRLFPAESFGYKHTSSRSQLKCTEVSTLPLVNIELLTPRMCVRQIAFLTTQIITTKMVLRLCQISSTIFYNECSNQRQKNEVWFGFHLYFHNVIYFVNMPQHNYVYL